MILIAATNRPDVLDPALLRPGRFDRQITVDRPDVRGQRANPARACRKPTLDTDVSLRSCPAHRGLCRRQLANLLNEAALLTARRNRSLISMDEIEESMERVMAGPQRKSRVMTETERRIIAYHESGHALVGHVLENSDPVHQDLDHQPRPGARVHDAAARRGPLPQVRREMLDDLAVFLGGRVAEGAHVR